MSPTNVSTRAVERPIVTLGEAMLRLSTARGERLEGASQLHSYVAGSEANVARTLARLGVPVIWLSAVTASPVGERIIRELRADGVDTSFVERPDGGRVGLFFAEYGSSPLGTRVWYDRERSAFTEMDAFREETLAGASFAIVSGITPALGSCAQRLVDSFVAAARREGARLCVDVNYRKLLWSAEAARRGLASLLAQADVVVCGERDARTVLEAAGDTEEILRHIARRWATRASIVVLTRGELGSVMLEGERLIEQPPIEAGAVLDRFGAGDAFLAGLVWALWNGRESADALRSGAALAAVKCAFAGDVASISASELALALEGSTGSAIIR